MSQTRNRVRPETSNNFLCLEIGERVTLHDYETQFIPAVKDIIGKYDSFTLAIVYGEKFLGWDMDAAEADLGHMQALAKYAKKIALINPPEVVIYRWETLKPLVGGETRIYAGDCFEEAIAWAKT